MPLVEEDPALTDALASYRQTWSERPFHAERVAGQDEKRDVTAHEDISSFRAAPAAPWTPGIPPLNAPGDGEQKFIWVIRTDAVPYACERCPIGNTIEGRGKLAHTNLTGGGDAYCGGELWFQTERKIWLTGGSGRYPPRSAEELEAVVSAFRAAGYEVTCPGWSSQMGHPVRYFREGDR